MRMRTFVREDGFTLIEMLVAVAVLGMLGLLAWRGLDALTRERQRIEEGIADTERIVRSLEQIHRRRGVGRILESQPIGHLG